VFCSDHDRLECRFCPGFRTFSGTALRSHEFLAHPEERPKHGYECRYNENSSNFSNESRYEKTPQTPIITG
jgi:hypothetical protein